VASTSIKEISQYLDTLLEVRKYEDLSFNGLQIESPVTEVTRVGFAVDSGLSVMERAVAESCQLLIAHHGVLWGGNPPITGALSRKVALCMTKGLSLYGVHLPLDGHLVHGNAAELAKLLDLAEIEPCFKYKGNFIGVSGRSRTPQRLEDISARLSVLEGALQPPLLLPFGPREITRVGIATGSATSVIPECSHLGIDLLITGEPKQEAYHTAREHQTSVICMGHYASETFGVRALQRVLEERFRVETRWISEPTGI
jgi:dinuclear metal center YbgI/SA1388 family protein